MAVNVGRTGLVELYAAFASAPGQYVKFGETQDMTDVHERSFFHNVPGDRHGGPQGPPIEVQWLGSIAIVHVTLSRWDPTNIDLLRQHAVATLGTILDSEVGTFMLSNKAIRLVLYSQSRPLEFPCAIVREPIAYGMGTKYTAYDLQFECHRHPSSGILYTSTLGITTTTSAE